MCPLNTAPDEASDSPVRPVSSQVWLPDFAAGSAHDKTPSAPLGSAPYPAKCVAWVSDNASPITARPTEAHPRRAGPATSERSRRSVPTSAPDAPRIVGRSSPHGADPPRSPSRHAATGRTTADSHRLSPTRPGLLTAGRRSPMASDWAELVAVHTSLGAPRRTARSGIRIGIARPRGRDADDRRYPGGARITRPGRLSCSPPSPSCAGRQPTPAIRRTRGCASALCLS